MMRPLPNNTMITVLLCLALAATRASGADRPEGGDLPKARVVELMGKAKQFAEKDYSIQTWNGMRFALNEAQAVAKREGATAADLNSVSDKLSKAIDALQKRRALPDDSPRLGLSASLVATNPSGPVNNVALMWASADPFDPFELQRAADKAGPYETIYTGVGTSFNDYALADGTYFYKVVASKAGQKLPSNVASVTTTAMPAGLASFSNQQASKEGLPGDPLKAGNTYYSFQTVREGKGLKHVLARTSTDGRQWSEGKVVMDSTSHPDLADCKFESGSRFYDKVNDQIVWWCHWELSSGYSNGKALVATAKPGERFKVHHIYNPLGIQVRDMSVFVDDDHKGYLVAASNVPGQGANATLYIFKLNDTYDDAVEIVAKVAEDGYREAPHVIRDGGFYYLFFSQAAGWYPSRGGYVSAKSIEGPWNGPRSIGNTSTFSSQSGWILPFGFAEKRVPIMMGSRWIRGEGTSQNSVLPIHFADGFAFYDYAPILLHDVSKSLLIPLQMGRLLSQGKPADSSIPGKPGHEAACAFDGNYESFYEGQKKEWPFTLTTDLGAPCNVRNVQISWLINKGSEAYYTYSIEGSLDGKQWVTMMDRTDANSSIVNKTYGFTSDILPDQSVARYVRIKVQQAHLHNNPNNWYAPTVYEVKVFGEAKGAVDGKP